jgi:hypothetical protein
MQDRSDRSPSPALQSATGQGSRELTSSSTTPSRPLATTKRLRMVPGPVQLPLPKLLGKYTNIYSYIS